jgi:hypothetical protein
VRQGECFGAAPASLNVRHRRGGAMRRLPLANRHDTQATHCCRRCRSKGCDDRIQESYMYRFRAAILLSLAFALVQSACAGVGPREREARKLEQVMRYAGDPVDSFRFWEIDSREMLGPEYFAVWTKINEAWLIKVDKPCWGLEFAHGVGLTSTQHRVHRKFDMVLVEDQRCRIDEIRPIDARKLKAERRGEIHPPQADPAGS